MPAAQRSSSGKETQPLLQPRSPSAGVGPGAQAPPVQTSIGRPSPKFLGLYLWQWGLVGLAALCLYGIYLVGAALAWRHGKLIAACGTLRHALTSSPRRACPVRRRKALPLRCPHHRLPLRGA